MASSNAYAESSIRVLKGLEPVRQRPGMYTRTDNPLHIVQEVLDNAADEALAGFGRRIRVTLHADGSVSVEDEGRGIPHGRHPDEDAPVLELVFTRLHAGGKFDKGQGGAYSFSGGLHGVGVSVTNALARRLEVSSWRDGQVARMAFAGGEVAEPLTIRPADPGERRSGTAVRVWPDPKYFDSVALPQAELVHLLRSKAVLMPGLTVTLVLEKTRETQSWQYKGGLRDYLLQSLPADPVIPPFEGEAYAHLRRRAQLYGFVDGQRQDLHPADSADLDWPLSPDCEAEANAPIRASRRFCVNLLAAGQQGLADRFAGRLGRVAVDRFADGGWTRLATGAPALLGCRASFDCTLVTALEAGTHTVFVGLVEAVATRPELAPLVYHDGEYGLVAQLGG